MQKPLPALCIIVLLSISFTYQTASQAVFDSTLIHSSTTVYFDTDQSTLRHEYKHNLIHLADTVHYLKNYAFRLVGHTDEKGSDDYNMKLSESRAMEIRNQLISLGIPDSVIHFEYRGERDPAAEGTDLTSDSLNRRVTINVYRDQKFVALEGKLLDDHEVPVQNAEVQILAPGWRYDTDTDSTGSFDVLAPAWKDITIQAFAPGYFYKSQHFNQKELLESPVLPLAIPKIEIDKKFKLENLYFHGNLAMLLHKSKHTLEALSKTMLLNPEACFEIAGHINRPRHPDVPRDSWNFELSVARATAIHDSMVFAGIEKDRILIRGYGNWQMLFPYANSSEQQSMNRRVEIIVRDCMVTQTDDRLEHNDASTFYFSLNSNKFKPQSFHINQWLLSPVEREKIWTHARKLKELGQDPGQYTLRELLNGEIKDE